MDPFVRIPPLGLWEQAPGGQHIPIDAPDQLTPSDIGLWEQAPAGQLQNDDPDSESSSDNEQDENHLNFDLRTIPKLSTFCSFYWQAKQLFVPSRLRSKCVK